MHFLLSGTFIIYFLMVIYLTYEAAQIFLDKTFSTLAALITALLALSFPLYWILTLFFCINLPEKLGTVSVYIAPTVMYLTFFGLIARLLSYVPLAIFTSLTHVQIAGIVVTLTALTLGIGNYLATNTVVERATIDLTHGKSVTHTKKVVIFSDTHAGNSFHKEDLAKLANLINKENPDFVLAVGDIIDSSPKIAFSEGLDKEFLKIKAPVYAVVGNHEYINGGAACVKFLQKAGFTVLLDEGIEIAPNLYIYGRRDVSASRFGYLSKDTSLDFPKDKTTLVLDHTPSRTKEAATAGAKFIIGGHTHNGQLFPLNFITKSIFPVSYGLGKTGDATILVSSGFGLWGPRIRTTGQSEIWSITLKY